MRVHQGRKAWRQRHLEHKAKGSHSQACPGSRESKSWKWGKVVTSQSLPQWHASSSKDHNLLKIPWVPQIGPLTGANIPSVQMFKPMGAASHSNHQSVITLRKSSVSLQMKDSLSSQETDHCANCRQPSLTDFLVKDSAKIRVFLEAAFPTSIEQKAPFT